MTKIPPTGVTIGLVPPPNVGIPIYSVPEDGGSVPVCVEVVSGNLAPGISVSVTFNTNNGVAVGEFSRKHVNVGLDFMHEYILQPHLTLRM